ncbi:MAG: uridine kinase [Clostridia bacterium]|nr:uridine kinase [Clostridia bacterium]
MNDILLIGICGGSGSGKSTLARNIAEQFGDGVALIRHDDYYKSQDRLDIRARNEVNYDHPDAFDTELLVKHLRALRGGEAISAPIYDYALHTRSGKVRRIEPKPVVILEGILIFADERLRELFDIKIFVDTDADIRILRRIVRDVKKRGRTLDSVISQYLSTVKPMHDAFVEPSKKHADIIIPEGGKNPVAYQTVSDRIRAHINGTSSKN